MSGYAGNSDLESEHAMILADNGVHAVREDMKGPVYEQCEDCGDDIPPKRIEYMRAQKLRCTRCIDCQEVFDKKPRVRIKMLDWVL